MAELRLTTGCAPRPSPRLTRFILHTSYPRYTVRIEDYLTPVDQPPPPMLVDYYIEGARGRGCMGSGTSGCTGSSGRSPTRWGQECLPHTACCLSPQPLSSAVYPLQRAADRWRELKGQRALQRWRPACLHAPHGPGAPSIRQYLMCSIFSTPFLAYRSMHAPLRCVP